MSRVGLKASHAEPLRAKVSTHRCLHDFVVFLFRIRHHAVFIFQRIFFAGINPLHDERPLGHASLATWYVWPCITTLVSVGFVGLGEEV